MLKKGFTLVELLVVMGVLAVLAAGLIVGINPTDKINSANDTKVQNDIGQIAAAVESYAASNNGNYPIPGTGAAQGLNLLKTNGDLVFVPVAPTGYTTYVYSTTPAVCDNLPTGTACSAAQVTGQLKSSKYTSFTTWMWDSATAKACAWSGSACQ